MPRRCSTQPAGPGLPPRAGVRSLRLCPAPAAPPQLPPVPQPGEQTSTGSASPFAAQPLCARLWAARRATGPQNRLIGYGTRSLPADRGLAPDRRIRARRPGAGLLMESDSRLGRHATGRLCAPRWRTPLHVSAHNGRSVAVAEATMPTSSPRIARVCPTRGRKRCRPIGRRPAGRANSGVIWLRRSGGARRRVPRGWRAAERARGRVAVVLAVRRRRRGTPRLRQRRYV
jgi:hypothetical protein